MRFLLTFLLLAGPAFAESHWNANQVRKYVHSADLQRRTGWKLIAQLNLSGTKNVLDVGCGDGRATSALADLVPQGRVQGIDPNMDMLTWAKRQYLTDGYKNLSFAQGDFNTINKESEYDLITGFYSFHLVDCDKRDEALNLIHRVLKPGGQVAMAIPPAPETNPEWFTAIGEQIKSPKWSKYFSGKQKSSFSWENEQTLRNRFRKINWSSLEFKFIPYRSPFVDKDEFSSWVQGTLDFVQNVPSNVRHEFVSNIIDCYIQKRPSALSSNGIYFGDWGYYTVIASKYLVGG